MEQMDGPDSLAGQAAARLQRRMNELDTSFKRRLGEPITDQDRDRAQVDMLFALMTEVVSLWRGFEGLGRQMGIERFDIEERD